MKIKSLYITYMGLSEPLLHSQALSYLKALSHDGIKVYILSFEKKQFLKKEKADTIKMELETSGIKWFSLGYHKRFQFLSKPYDIIRGVLFAFYISMKERIEVIHVRGTFCALIGIMPCLFLRKKMIFDMRGLMAEEYADAGLWKRNSFRYKFISKAEKYFTKKGEAVIILTEKTRKLVGQIASRTDCIATIPACVDLGRFKFSEDSNAARASYSLNGKVVLIYVGSIGTWYMLSEMIEFYEELNRQNNNSVFFILSQTDRAVIGKYIPHSLKAKIIVDSAAVSTVPNFINIANIGIFFIKPCFSKIASMPTKFAEYLACGLPVVINKGIGDTEEIVKENRVGVVVEDFNVKYYRNGIDSIFNLMKEGLDLRRRCRNTAERYFSLEEGTRRYRDIYSRLAQVK